MNSEIHSEAVIERLWRWNRRPRLSELRNALGGCDRASLEMHFEAVIEWVWWCTLYARLSELRYSQGGRDRASLEEHFEAVIEPVWRHTWRPWSSAFGDVLGDWDCVHSIMHWEAVMEGVWTCTWRQRSCELQDAIQAVIERIQRCSCSRLWSREIRGIVGGGWSRGVQWDARKVLRIYSSDSSLETVGMWWSDFTF